MSALLKAGVAIAAAAALSPPHLEPSAPKTPERLGTDSPGTVAVAEDLGVLTLKAPSAPMILVPKSTFTMGSSGDDMMAALVDCQREPAGQRCEPTLFSVEGPEHTVTLSAYWLDRTEVTVADYARCAELRRCRPLPFQEGGRRFDRPDFPASLVTFDEAREYCAARGARLPTEAEFERAARGEGRRVYPWGNLYNSHASNHGRLAWDTTSAEDGYAELAPVGSFPSGATPDGFLDLAGNVAEWVADRYAVQYPEGAQVDPRGPVPPLGTPARVVRGGSYQSAGPFVRGASRGAEEPSARRPWIGFRCARSVRRF